MELTIGAIAQKISANVLGDPDKIIKNVSSFEDATQEDITFASDPKFLKKIDTCKATAIIVPEEEKYSPNHISSTTLLLCKHPKRAFFQLVKFFHPPKKVKFGILQGSSIGKNCVLGLNYSIGPNAVLSENVCIGNNAHIMAGAFIGDDVELGNNVIIKPNVTILEKTKIGNNVIIHSGTVIGSDGFGFVQASDQNEKIVHTGYVEIGNDVEIGANCTIDRGTLGKTIIGNGVKMDNQVHLAHNVKIGDHSLVVAQVGIAGSTEIGNHVIIAGKAGISGHLTIGDYSIVGPYAGVHSNVGEHQIVSGIPHMPHTRWRKVVSVLSRLPEIRKKVLNLEKRIKLIDSTSLTEKK